MKKLFITAGLLLAMIFVYGQKKEKNNAYNFYANGYYDRAKEAIDRAILNDETKEDASVWMYRGNIYLRLAVTTDKEYKNLCKNCAETAFEAYFKALDLDPKVTVNMDINNPAVGLKYCALALYDDAVKLYTEAKPEEIEKYEKAHSLAEKAYKADHLNEDIVYLYALTAEAVKNWDAAKKGYGTFIGKTKKIMFYVRLANIYKSEKDTTKTLSTLKAGVPIFFGDSINVDYAVAYSIALSWAGKTEEAREIMNKALEKYPNNHILLINYGSELTNVKNYEEAEKYLKRAIELQPNEITAIYNLGNCYYNSYVDKMNALKDVNDDDEYERLKAEYTELLKEARPYLEKAHGIDPKDKNTLLMLKTVYARLALYDEVKVVDEKINALGK